MNDYLSKPANLDVFNMVLTRWSTHTFGDAAADIFFSWERVKHVKTCLEMRPSTLSMVSHRENVTI
jgi:hypothetical protein